MGVGAWEITAVQTSGQSAAISCVCVYALAARGRSLARFKCVYSCYFGETCMDEEREKLFFSRGHHF